MTKMLLLIVIAGAACIQPGDGRMAQTMIVREFCLGAKDEASFHRVEELSRETGCAGVKDLVLAEKVFPLEPGDAVELLATVKERTLVRNSQGTMWVASQYLGK